MYILLLSFEAYNPLLQFINSHIESKALSMLSNSSNKWACYIQ